MIERVERVVLGDRRMTVEQIASNWYGARHTQTILLFWLMALSFGMRVNLSVGIVAMTDPEANPNSNVRTFVWTDESIILSSFYWGYLITAFIAGHLAKVYGTKLCLTVTTAAGSLVSILLPFVAQFGSWTVITCRVVQGLAQGFIFPCVHDLLSKWVPPSERTRLGAFVYTAGAFGAVIAMPLTGWISGTRLGWPYAFYIYGVLGLLWTVVWIVLGRNSPADHKGIHPQEKIYIEVSLGQSHGIDPSSTPWKEIFTSLPVWGLIFVHSGHLWGFTTLFTYIPIYMEYVLNFDIKSVSALPTYEWKDESIILSSFYWGYLITTFIAGHLAKVYGSKLCLIVATAAGSLVSILLPLVAQFGSWTVITCRVLQGLAQGFIFPCVHNLLSKWVPPSERARLGAFVYTAGPFGTVISMPFTGWISETSLGWPYAFYIYGAVGLLWSLVWIVLGRNSPADHKDIHPQEKDYIEVSLGQTHVIKPPSTPWKEILTSLPVWGLIFAHSGHSWGFSTLLTNIPTYMDNVLNFDIKSNGLLSAAPYLALWLWSFVYSSMTDYIITHRYLSTGSARKIANTIGFCGPAAALLALGLVSSSERDITNTILALLFLAVGINGSAYSGYSVNHMDLSPVHAGTLIGLTNGISNIFSIIGPLLLQFIVTEQDNPMQWAIVFYIASAIYVSVTIIFVILGSGELQSWNESIPHQNHLDCEK
ncbi:hypothetical protein RI129_010239 [Pyrocoelia pectoralis]|uniref:Major facilitator superfamily (MFS) profile domain-containing protein n=1 Tax=Pyrocoelia pectoralis TaxID=417401 RepID=A0AAN7ZGV5_9COLE